MIEQKKYINFIKMYSKAYLGLRKEKGNMEVGWSSVIKSEKRSGAVQRDYHWIKMEGWEVPYIQHNILGESCFAAQKKHQKAAAAT